MWNVELVYSDKKNSHTCGDYTANTLDKSSKLAMRAESKNIFQPFLSELVSDCKALSEKVNANDQLIEAICNDAAMSQDELINIAISVSKDDWPKPHKTSYVLLPAIILFTEVFQKLDQQCLVVDALIRTGWLESSKGRLLHQRLAKPIRAYMQDSAYKFKQKLKAKNA